MVKTEKNPVIPIAGTIGGISLVIVIVFLAMAPEQINQAVYIVGILAAMGEILGYVASKKK